MLKSVFWLKMICYRVIDRQAHKIKMMCAWNGCTYMAGPAAQCIRNVKRISLP